MAGTVMHLVVADRLLDILKIENPAYFYCGNLAPDAIMARENYVREMKRHTHFKDDIFLHELREPEKQKVYLDRLMQFFKEYVEPQRAQKEIYLGYLTHMLVDELYILRYRDPFVDRLIAAGKSPKDEQFWDGYPHEVDVIDWELVRTYNFKYKMPEALVLEEHYEIEGYITNEELLDSKQFIINKNFITKHEPEELKYTTREYNRDFIELCVSEIPKILCERFGLAALIKTMSVNGKEYSLEKLLGKGKGGYSYLAVSNTPHYVVAKQIHHEPCEYYSFGNKIEAEINDYKTLSALGIRMPLMLDVDIENERLIKEFIEGDTIASMVEKGQSVAGYIDQVKAMCDKLYEAGLNIDYYPTNFVVQNGILYYIDYECNKYSDEWNFENWGIKYWGNNSNTDN